MERNESEPWPKLTRYEVAGSSFNETELYEIREDDLTPDAFPVGTSQTYVGLVSGLLTVALLFFSCTAFLIKQRGRNKVALLQKHTALLCDSSVPGITITPKDVKLPNSIVNGLSLGRKPVTIVGSATIATIVTAPAARKLPDHPERTRVNSRLNVDSDHCSSVVYETSDKLFSEENFVFAQASESTLVTESHTGEYDILN